MKTVSLKLDQIQVDAGTQVRVAINQEVVEDYAQALQAGTKFPPVQVFHDGSGDRYLMADGFHRLAAHELAGRRVIQAQIGAGSRDTAIIFAAGANRPHGHRMSRADKRSAVEKMFGSTWEGQWSDAQIAAHVGVSQPFVSKLRAKWREGNGTNNVIGYPQAGAPDSDGGGQCVESPETRADAGVDGGGDTVAPPGEGVQDLDTHEAADSGDPHLEHGGSGAEGAPAPQLGGAGAAPATQERATAAATEPRKRGTEPEHDLADVVDALTERLRELEGENKVLREEIDSMRERNEDESVQLIKRLKADLQVAYSQRDDFMRQSSELKREVKSRDRQIERLKKHASA